MRTKNLIHPGEILLEEFLIPLGISQTRLALDLRVPRRELMRLFAGSVRLLQIRRCGLVNISRWSLSFGLIFSLIMI